MKNSTIIRVVIFGALAIVSIIGIQSYWVTRTWHVKEQEFEERVNVALYNVAKEFEKLGNQLPAYDLINQVSTNYYIVNINDVITSTNLEYFLRRELESVGLNEDFEYGIYDCATNQMVYGDYITYSALTDTTGIRKNDLPISDKFTYYFGVRFPNRTSQILSNMGISIFFSAILLVTIAFFLFSIFVILRQKRLSEMQKDFINNMTHEFKTPISTIRISADVFLSNPLIRQDERLIQYPGIIKDQNTRLNNQVEKVLQLAKVERDNFKLKLEQLDLREVLQETAGSAHLKVSELGGHLNCSIPTGNLPILADRLHLTNILYNLLDNAIKYCREEPVIDIEAIDRGRDILLRIADQGIGIPAEHQPKVFKKFYRIPTGNVHDVKGFGLGLYYIKSVCTAQGWKIQLRSEPGCGTTIDILIPKYQPRSERWISRLFRRAAFS